MQKNAYFRLSLQYGGLFMVLYPPSGDGLPLELGEVQKYLKKNQIKLLDPAELSAALGNQTVKTEIMLSESPIPHVRESLLVSASKDKMSATARFFAGTEKGALLDKDDILGSIRSVGIIHGVDEAEIDSWLENRQYCTDIPVAAGTPPEKSTDAVIDYMFEVEKKFRATVEPDGAVNFHELNLFNNIASGDVLAVLTPAYRGEPGMNVLGMSLASRSPANKALKYGKNVGISDDGCTLTAIVSGFVELDSDRVIVENVYAIKGDVGPATGDIVFDGIVRVSGDILAGYSVKATSDVVIEGVVESTHVTAGGNIVIANGVHGGAKAFISAGGDIICKFIQEAVVHADGSIITGSILYSNVTSRDCIEVLSGKGLVKGGELRARNRLALRTVGTMRTGSNTQLEVGVGPDETERFAAMEEELAWKRAEQTKARQGLSFLQRKISQGAALTSDQEKLMKVLPHKLDILDSEIGKMYQRYSEMKESLMKSDAGKIVIEDTIYDGAKIIISGISYYVREDLVQCRFSKKDMAIKVESLDS